MMLKKREKNILTVGFDTSWSHVRNASQASGEFIYHGIPEGKYNFVMFSNIY